MIVVNVKLLGCFFCPSKDTVLAIKMSKMAEIVAKYEIVNFDLLNNCINYLNIKNSQTADVWLAA